MDGSASSFGTILDFYLAGKKILKILELIEFEDF